MLAEGRQVLVLGGGSGAGAPLTGGSDTGLTAVCNPGRATTDGRLDRVVEAVDTWGSAVGVAAPPRTGPLV